MPTQFFRNNDLLEWVQSGDISVAAGSSGETTIFGTFFWNAQGTSQPAVTISQEEFGVTESVPEGYPRYYLRVLPATAPALSGTDRAFLEYKLVEDGDRAFQGAYGIFSFWCKTPLAKEIVVRCIRDLGTGGATITGASTVEIGRQSFQLTNAWKKYEVKLRFEELAGATYGANSSIKLRIYLQGGSGELGGNGINWVNSLTDFASFSFTRQAEREFERSRLSSDSSSFSSDTAITTIYATDPRYGAVGDYTGTQNTAGTGTDNRAAIQAALNAAYTEGPGGVNDTVNNVSYRVIIPKGKYYISAPADGSPSLVVPLKVELVFEEAQLFFDKPPLGDFGHGIQEPNPLWCAIKIGNMSGLKIGKMQMILSQDLTYGGTWFGMSLDAIRVQEADICFIEGAGSEHYILGFQRGAAIRYIASWNCFVEKLNISACCFGIVMSYFGTAFSAYTRYRGTSQSESVSTSLWVSRCSFLNIYKKAIYVGVNGDYHAPANVTATSGTAPNNYEIGGFEVVTFDRLTNGGPISIMQCAFENIAEEIINVTSQSGLFISDIRMEECGMFPVLGQIYASTVRSFKLDGCTSINAGTRQVYHAHYTGPLDQLVTNPTAFVRVDATNVSPRLVNVYINNQASNGCQLVNGTINVTRLPTIESYRTETSTQMQGTNSYMQNLIPENDGGRRWGISTLGLRPTESVNGSRTTFTFPNGFTRQRPQRILVDGQILEAIDSAGTVNWTWNTSTTDVTFTVAPTKNVRAFF